MAQTSLLKTLAQCGTPLQEHWFNRTRQYAARNQGEELREDQYVFAESVALSPIPCWGGSICRPLPREDQVSGRAGRRGGRPGRGGNQEPASLAPIQSWPRIR